MLETLLLYLDCQTKVNKCPYAYPSLKGLSKICQPYHTRGTQKALFNKFGRIVPNAKPAHLRYFYSELTGDVSASINFMQADVDSRIRLFIDLEDPNIITDIRTLN